VPGWTSFADAGEKSEQQMRRPPFYLHRTKSLGRSIGRIIDTRSPRRASQASHEFNRYGDSAVFSGA
jgi:hypothetical protein